MFCNADPPVSDLELWGVHVCTHAARADVELAGKFVQQPLGRSGTSILFNPLNDFSDYSVVLVIDPLLERPPIPIRSDDTWHVRQVRTHPCLFNPA